MTWATCLSALVIVAGAGAKPNVPGPDRQRALSALSAARNAILQAGADAPRQREAAEKLKQAESLFGSARYTDAAEAADAAWQLVSESAHQATRFTVEVADGGQTRVTAQSGKPVRVEAEGIIAPVYAGQVVTVVKGQAPQGTERPRPPPAEPAPPPPTLLAPPELAKLRLKSSERGLGPVVLSWKPAEGARAYEVEVASDDSKTARPLVLKVTRVEARLPPLPSGRYRWSVRSLGEETRSEPSATRGFELWPETLKLEVQETQWK